MKRRVESGPHETPVIPSEKLYSTLFDLVPGTCLFTITESPSNTVEVIQQQDQCDEVCSAEHGEEQLHTSNEEEQLRTRNE